ncbi:MAG: hypothetical protein VYC39_11480 [Myxococcota bacterium]|nr:hypothetical protein [Myxococcota bacterium]
MIEKSTFVTSWVRDQKSLARALGLSIEDWIRQLEQASERRTELTAAVIGAATSKGLGLGVISRVNGERLAHTARGLLDPEPPQVTDPVLAEAIRRADEMSTKQGLGASRLKRKREHQTPSRSVGPERESATEATADAPGEVEP